MARGCSVLTCVSLALSSRHGWKAALCWKSLKAFFESAPYTSASTLEVGREGSRGGGREGGVWREGREGGVEGLAGRQAGRQAGRRAGGQAGRQAGS